MTDGDLSWMNVPGPDGLTWAQKYAGAPTTGLEWMNVVGPNGLTWAQEHSITGVQAPTGPGTPAQAATEDQNALAYITKLLDDMNLGALKDRVWDYIVKNGAKDENRLFLWMTEQPEFDARFPAYKELQKDAKRAITPGQYMALERSYKQIMQDAGIPSEFFDMKPGDNDFTDLIRNEVSPDEFQKRVQDGYERVAKSDITVRNAFRDYFGVDGDAALAAFFIDPQRSRPALIQAAKAAEIGGIAKSMFMDVGLNYASKLASMGISKEQAISGFNKMAAAKDLFASDINETQVISGGVSESELGSQVQPQPDNRNHELFTSGTTFNESGITYPTGTRQNTDNTEALGIDYIFGTNVETQRELQLRLAKRKAQASGTVQNIVTNKSGSTNLGSTTNR